MKYSTIVLNLALCVGVSNAFSPSIFQHNRLTIQRRTTQQVLFSSQWDDEDDEVATEPKEPTSFDDAGAALKEEDDDKAMDNMADFDANPQYRSSDIDRVRAALKERTESLGIEKSKVSAEMIQAAQEKAMQQVSDRGSAADGGLDLSQITSTGPRGEGSEDIPAMFYDPEAEMSEEEMIEADPDGQLPIPEQVVKEISLSAWPTPFAALKDVFLLVAVVLGTAFTIINWDNFLRETYTNLGMVPTPEEIMQGSDNMALPEGWTNGMTEDDFMNFQDEVGKVAEKSESSSVSSLLPEL